MISPGVMSVSPPRLLVLWMCAGITVRRVTGHGSIDSVALRGKGFSVRDFDKSERGGTAHSEAQRRGDKSVSEVEAIELIECEMGDTVMDRRGQKT